MAWVRAAAAIIQNWQPLTNQVEAEDGKCEGAKQWEHSVHGAEEGVQECIQRRAQEHIQHHVHQPQNGQNAGDNAECQLQPVQQHGDDPQVVRVGALHSGKCTVWRVLGTIRLATCTMITTTIFFADMPML